MPIQTNESTSDRKSIDVTVTPSAAGVTVSGSVRWVGDVLYQIPSVVIACPYVDDATYRVALCSTPPRLVLVEDDAVPADEVCYLARWAFKAAADTCATVAMEVKRIVLVPRPPTITDVPIMGLVPKPALDADGNPVLDENGEPVVRMVERQIGTEQVTTPAPPLPPPTVHAVSATVVLPAQDAERAMSRRRRARIRDLRQQLVALRDAGTTVTAMTAAQRSLVVEYVGLTGEIAPLAVP